MSINVTLVCPIYSSLISIKSLLNEISILEIKYHSIFEIIIINDSSPHINEKEIENLFNIIPSLIKYRYIKLERNIGVGAIRNRGISMANSQKYISFIDDDDIPDLKNILNTAMLSSDDIVISPIKNFRRGISFREIYNSKIKFFYFFLRGLLKTVAWNKLYKLSFIKSEKAFFSNQRLFEDELFLLHILFSNGKKSYSFINKPFVRVFKRKNSRSRSFNHSDISTYIFIQFENFKFVSRKSSGVLFLWLLFFLPKSMISFVLAYLRSFYNRRIVNL